MVQYIVKESIEYGCTVYNVINTKSGNRVNYFPDEKSAISFAERMNFFKNKNDIRHLIAYSFFGN